MTRSIPDSTADDYTEIIVAELIRTERFKRFTRSLTRALTGNWAGDSGFRKRLAASIENSLEKSLAAPPGPDSAPVSGAARETPDFTEPLIMLANDLLDGIDRLGSALQTMPVEKKEALLEKIVGSVDFGKLGGLTGPAMRALTEIHDRRPTFVADVLKNSLTDRDSEMDFAAVRDHLAGSQEDISSLARLINDALWASPEKVMEALEMIIAAVNLFHAFLGEFMSRFSRLKIEEITDMFLHLVARLDGQALGSLLNAMAHINRKIMRGTEELRNPAPDLPTSENVLMQKFEEIAGKIDPNLIFNLRLSLEELKVPLREWLMSD